MRHLRLVCCALLLASAGSLAAAPALAQPALDIVSQRPGSPEAPLYAGFTRQSGIVVRFVPNPGGGALRALGETPRGAGDVMLGTDAAGIFPAEQAGLFEPYTSAAVEARVPAALRHPQQLWTGVSARARVIFARADMAEPPRRFEDLAEPRYRGQVCIGPGTMPYNLSLIGRMVAHHGEAGALRWARGLVANLAEGVPVAPDGAQILAVAAGRCSITLANHYDYVRMLASGSQAEAIEKLRLVWPNQGEGEGGALINVTAVGLLRGAPHRESAIRFIEYLLTDEAQQLLAGAMFMPVVAGVPAPEGVRRLGTPRWDRMNVATLGANRPAAERIQREAGWPAPAGGSR